MCAWASLKPCRMNVNIFCLFARLEGIHLEAPCLYFSCASYQPCCTCSYLSCSHARAGSPAACVDVLHISKFHMSACASYQPCYTCSFVFTRPATPPVTRRASLLYIYTLLHDYNMNVNMRTLHPLHIFDAKYIVDHSAFHVQENCHDMSWQCKPIHVGTATNAHPRALVAHTCTKKI